MKILIIILVSILSIIVGLIFWGKRYYKNKLEDMNKGFENGR